MTSATAVPAAPVPAHRFLAERPRLRWARTHPHAPYLALAAVCVGAFMGQLDASIVTVALPSLQHTFRTGIDAVTWVGLSYLLVLVAGLPAAGRAGDRYGRKLVYGYGFVVFVVGSICCAIAPDLAVLLAARVLQAAGAAMLQANSVAIVSLALPAERVTRGLGIQATAQALGLALGPTVGGLLLVLGGWRLIFLVNVPVGIVGAVAARLLVPRSRDLAPARAEERGRRRERTWTRPVGANLAAGLLSYVLLFGTMLVVPFLLERGEGLSPATTGLTLSALPVALGLVAPLAGHRAGRTGEAAAVAVVAGRQARRTAAGGLLLASAAIAVAALTVPPVWALALLLAAIGAGIGAFTPVNNAAVMLSAPRNRAGAASGSLNRARGAGTAVGIAVTGAVYGATARAGGATLAAARHGFAVTALVLAGAGALAAALAARAARARTAT